ncbi:MAG TPA: RDD family protein [Bryobacteraceae bacterium]|jgi:uncharacterized RDD family membrane protein YckC|nr:RDD family protein [Bryobacteraceae bacterium]
MSRSSRTIEIETPEGVRFSLLLAGPLARFVAWIVDACAVVVISQVLGQALSLTRLISADIAQASAVVLYFAISIGYGIALEWRWRGQTLGKRLLRLRVMDEQGLHLRFSQVVIRNLMRAVDAAPAFYMTGGLACLLSAKARRLGDLAAGTIVVRNPKLPHPDLAQLLEGKFNSMLAYDTLVRRLRQHASPEAAGIAIQALVRRDQLAPEARVEVFHEIADYFRSLAEFPEEAVAQITDEQYVRNVVEILAGRMRRPATSTPLPG